MDIISANNQIRSLLQRAGLPYKEIHVCGRVVGVYCVGRDTAEKWLRVLSRFVPNATIRETVFTNKVNTGTCLLPSTHKGFVVGGML